MTEFKYDGIEVIHISHDDLDGRGPTNLSKVSFGKKVLTINASYHNIDEIVTNVLQENTNLKTKIFITDIFVNDEVAAMLDDRVKKGQEIILIDHHKGNLEAAEKYKWMTVVVEENQKLTAATTLYYNYLIQNGYLERSPVLDEFTEMVRMYDTWDWFRENNQKAKSLNDLYYIIGAERFDEDLWDRLNDRTATSFEFTTIESAILDLEKERIARYIEKKEKQLIISNFEEADFNFTIGVLYGEQYHSELGNKICLNHPEIDFAVIADLGAKKFSFRSVKPEMNTIPVAKHFGGNGHPPASGCPLTEESYNAFIKKILSKGE
ncbi:phosphoesterase [Bacillus toyonensis]|uniref:DHH family phosphoesterase n=1 Tax=Bacillus toyonensis TaxID=155322 RepID=UPI002E1EE1BF|nr:phosphoesterase [Bacillus toyonensis]